MTRTHLQIRTVEKPLRNGVMWSGKATTARRAYDWYYTPSDGRVSVMVNRPAGSGWYWYLRSVPAAFKAEIKRAVEASNRAGEAS